MLLEPNRISYILHFTRVGYSNNSRGFGNDSIKFDGFSSNKSTEAAPSDITKVRIGFQFNFRLARFDPRFSDFSDFRCGTNRKKREISEEVGNFNRNF